MFFKNALILLPKSTTELINCDEIDKKKKK